MRYLLIPLLCLLPVFCYADEAKDMAADPVLERRMIGLAEKLRCLVCQNESLASSHSELAEDLRREVREQMQKGMNDQEIIDYLVARYGDFVLYDPPVKKTTLVLWYGPFALLLIGAGVLVYQLRKRKGQIAETELSPAEAQRAAEMLGESQEMPGQPPTKRPAKRPNKPKDLQT
ncbi:MAG: cytochrome C biogenesis protein CcmH [Gallionellales bacterium RIFCSPLOWO2_12_FULL_59_22]|nr:MAG: cytochrome C biogenesis protein CcmH [Gallionellales bacterium RIFCSPLOWO2_02_FULL_59_110]OGT03590.1 MAG: cytochrome C biogenesis protein CcmH [Gallionellales bacterium RIFCSPLOWO2_02_58_13]OGT14699.1 MAG: cytochrome C biogenesis protein CcmH [Gallionellales bacterium RIFCSPLOWO2_12_FULL_59_22]